MLNDNNSNTANSLRTLERGLDVLDCFFHGEIKLSLTEIASRINLTPSTATRILATLEKRNYLIRDSETKKYQLGERFLSFISPSVQSFDIRIIAAPYLKRLYDLYNESVTLYILLDGQRVCIDRIETTHGLRRVINIGDRLSLTRGASGKVLLAWLPEEQRKVIWQTDPAVPYKEFDQIRLQGFATSISERDEGVASVSAPIFDGQEQMVAALAIAIPTVRLAEETIPRMIPSVMETAKEISIALGYKRK